MGEEKHIYFSLCFSIILGAVEHLFVFIILFLFIYLFICLFFCQFLFFVRLMCRIGFLLISGSLLSWFSFLVRYLL